MVLFVVFSLFLGLSQALESITVLIAKSKALFPSSGFGNLTVGKSGSDAEYALMPPIFEMDDFDECLSVYNRTLFCSFEYKLQPVDYTNSSEVWKIIEKTKQFKRYYYHDLLRHGVCLPKTCTNIPEDYYEVGEQNEKLKVGLKECYDQKYERLGIRGFVTQLHCEDNSSYYKIGVYDIFVAIIILSWLLLVILASIYEGRARYKTEKEYKEITETKFGRFVSCFSLPKNLYRLRRENKSPDTRDMKCIQGIRFYNMICVIMSHTLVASFAGPIYNTKYPEEMVLKPANILVANGMFIVQTFFTISGWLVSYHFLLMFEGKSIKYYYILLAFVNRYIRLTPVLFFLIAINGTWLAHAYRGPIWHKLVGAEYENCRHYGWVNLVYLNNYLFKQNTCMQHTWYIAADTQLFAISLILLTLMWRFQQHIKKILASAMIVAIVSPAIVNYIYNVDILMRSYPENLYRIFMNTPHYYMVHTAVQANFGGYLVGIIGGYMFYNYRGKNYFKNRKLLLVLWWIVIFGLPLTLILSGYTMYDDTYKGTRIISALYSGFARPLFAIAICMGIFGSTQKIGWFVRYFLEWGPVQVLGRLTYSSYLIHTSLQRVRSGLRRVPVYVSDFIFLPEVLGDVVLSYLMGFVLCLFAEMPISALQKLLVPAMEDKRLKGLNEISQSRVKDVRNESIDSRI